MRYFHRQGTFYTMATFLLEPHYLHPIDLTECEFVSLVNTEDSDAWISLHKHQLLHRVIVRRGKALRVLKEAGIISWEMENMEIFELLD